MTRANQSLLALGRDDSRRPSEVHTWRPLLVSAVCFLALMYGSTCWYVGATEVPFDRKDVTLTTSSPWSVFAADLDGDGDTDILSGTPSDLSWYENDGTPDGVGNWTKWTILDSAGVVLGVFATDVDGDGDLDVVSTLYGVDKISWFENDGTPGGLGDWNEWPISTTLDTPRAVFAADVDRDGDMDVISGAQFDSVVTWHENDGTPAGPETWTAHTISVITDHPHSVFAVDMDGDGDPDVLSGSSSTGAVAWHENDGSPVWPEHSINSVGAIAISVFAADVDGDGDPDALAAYDNGTVAWYENNGAWTPRTISATASIAWSVYGADVDSDGDMDVVSALYSDDTVAWYENDGSSPPVWTPRTISTTAIGVRSTVTADVDGDGDIDVLSGCADDSRITWYENKTIHRSASFAAPQVIDDDGSTLTKSVNAADIDGDGDMDVLATSNALFVGTLTWYENDGSPGGLGDWNDYEIFNLDRFREIFPVDLDHDGDLDVLTATGDGINDVLDWYENNGSPSAVPWPNWRIDGSQSTSSSIFAADLDGDGDADVLSAQSVADRVGWYENDGTPAGSSDWSERSVTTSVLSPRSVFAADVDGDGDTDVLSASYEDDRIAWYQNDGGAIPVFTAFDISVTADAATSVHAADLDGDGDTDVLSSSSFDSTIAWYQNDGGTTPLFPRYVISTTGGGPSLYAADLDGDGDVDVLAGNTWYENDGATNPSFAPHLTNATSPISGHRAADVDGDGDLDLLGTATGAPTAWSENVGGQFGIQTTSLTTGEIWVAFPTAVLELLAVNNGRPGDTAAELVALELLFEEAPGDPLTTTEANDLIENLFVYRDTGSGGFEASDDTLISTVEALSLTSGVQSLTFPDQDQGVEVIPGAPARFFIVVEPTLNGHLQTPNTLQVTELVSARSAEDREHGILLSQEGAADVSTAVMTAIFPDCNENTALDHTEVGVVTLLEESFEGGGVPTGWQGTGLWSVTDTCEQVAACTPGTYWAYYGQPGVCDFDTGDRTEGTLEAPAFDIPHHATDVELSYCSAYGGEAGKATVDGFDWAWVEANDTREDDVSFDNDQLGGETRTVDLTSFTNQNVTLRWHFDSVDGVDNGELGWQIDNVLVYMEATSPDCNENFIPDGCETDCNGNNVPDDCDLATDIPDCNGNTRPDSCDLVNNDCDGNGVPDECQDDCTGNGRPDVCDIEDEIVQDCGGNDIPDECEPDCQPNGVPDDCDIENGTSLDCSGNGVPDECELPEEDCNTNGVADSCDIFEGTSDDCNGNDVPDDCDIATGTSMDGNANTIPDECEIAITGLSAVCLSGGGCPTTGGDTITILGSGFTNVNPETEKIWFGTVAGTALSVSSDTEMTILAPIYAPGRNCSVQTGFDVPVSLVIPGRELIVSPTDYSYEIVSLRVPQDHTMIQGAIDAAEDGTCVIVAPGIYTENITLSPKDPPIVGQPDPRRSFTLTSETVDDPSSTRILGGTDLNPTDPAVIFDGNPSDVVLTGFEITLGNGGIVVENQASPLIVNNRIDNNFATGPGGGILVRTGSSPEIRSNRISTNFADGSGGGIAVDRASANFFDNIVSDNDSERDGGGLFANIEGGLTLSGNRIEQNTADGHGGGVFLTGGSLPMELADHSIVGNTAAGSGGGIYVETSQRLTLHANEILENVAGQNGGGLYLSSDTNVTVTLNRIMDNRTSTGDGAGVFASDVTAPVVRSNLISGNQVYGCNATSGGLSLGAFSLAEVTYNTINSNVAQRGGGIVVRVKGEPIIERNIIAFNQVRQNCAPPDPPPWFSPGILVGDDDELPGPGPMIINNTFHENTGGSTETGTMHGVRVGLFEPDWINNIVSEGQDWGIFCDRVNSGVRIEYNDLFGNLSGPLHPDCGPLDSSNLTSDPLFTNQNPTAADYDFSLQGNSPARGAGENGIDMGAVQTEATSTNVVADQVIVDDGSAASIMFSQADLDVLNNPPDPYNETEILIRLTHMDPELVPAGALTLIVEFRLIPDPDPVPLSDVTLTLPLRAPLPPGYPVVLYRWDETNGEFVDAEVPGEVDETGWLAVFSGVTQLSIFAGGTPVVSGQLGVPGEASDPRFEDSPFIVGKTTGGYALSWSTPPAGANVAGYRLYRVDLGTAVTNPVCQADLENGTSIDLAALPHGYGFVVVAMNAAGEGSYGRDSSGQERAGAQGGNVCP